MTNLFVFLGNGQMLGEWFARWGRLLHGFLSCIDCLDGAVNPWVLKLAGCLCVSAVSISAVD